MYVKLRNLLAAEPLDATDVRATPVGTESKILLKDIFIAILVYLGKFPGVLTMVLMSQSCWNRRWYLYLSKTENGG